MARTQTTPGTTPGGVPAGTKKRMAALGIYLVLVAGLILVIYVLHAAAGWQATAAAVVALIGTLVLHWAFPAVIPAVAAAVTVAALFAAHPVTTQTPQLIRVTTQTPQPSRPVPQLSAPARCPHTLEPMALVQTNNRVPQGRPGTTIGLGAAHIDNVISLDGSATVSKYETVCLTVTKAPAADRQLWLILRLREAGDNGTFYNLFYVVGALSDPAPVRYYSVPVDRRCSSQSSGDRHTLFVMSAPTSAAAGLWANYNARLNSLNSDCNTAYDGQRQHLPDGYFIVSEQGDVIQH